MTAAPSSLWLLLAPAAFAFPSHAIAARGGGDLDLFHVVDPLVVQAIQTGATPLIAGKSTVVRAPIGSSGTVPPGTLVDGLMRVFVGGVEAPYSPIYSDNGPIPVPAVLDPNQENASLNFIFVPPQANDVVLTVEFNPAGSTQVPETDLGNNARSTPTLVFNCRQPGEIVYVPIDYRPSGGSVPNVPDPAMIAPGMGDNFMQGSYPVPYMEYRRSEAPSKLWTASLSGTGSGLNNALLVDLQMMNPQPDFIYGWVPGGLPYNGQALGIPGKAAMGNTQDFRYQRTFAHEVGHLHGLQHIGGTTGLAGFDVERHLALPGGLPPVKVSSLSDFMVAGLNTNQAWVGSGSYTTIYNNAAYTCGQDSADDFALPTERRLLIAGLLDGDAGSLELTDSLVFAGGELTPSVPLAEANLILRAFAGADMVFEQGLHVASSADTCKACRSHDHDSDEHVSISGFVSVVPVAVDGVSIDRVVFVNAEGGAKLAELSASAHAPAAAFSLERPIGGDSLVEWSASDADGDALRFYLRYSPDGRRLMPLASGLTATATRVDFSQLPEAVSGASFLELLVSDGLHTTSVRQPWHPVAATFNSTGNAPWAEILSPDNGTTWRKGATVILHSSGWDLEDRGLSGNSIQWSSSVDGPLGVGRVTSVANLSVGSHVISVTATDSRGMSTVKSVTVNVTDRVLPGIGEVCQADLGSGGPGNAVLSVCGGDLSTGTTADLNVVGAAPGQPIWTVLATSSSAVPLFGGTLVPFPALTAPIVGLTSPTGTYSIVGIPGGGGPFSLFLQTLHLDLAQPESFGLSNAVRLDFLP
ncbi:MAG: hypothetical protein GC161_17655 [Planctomycetaceae bacterium]|nr:hypothetical protein [Planctomycetaceae bacterium]